MADWNDSVLPFKMRNGDVLFNERDERGGPLSLRHFLMACALACAVGAIVAWVL